MSPNRMVIIFPSECEQRIYTLHKNYRSAQTACLYAVSYSPYCVARAGPFYLSNSDDDEGEGPVGFYE